MDLTNKINSIKFSKKKQQAFLEDIASLIHDGVNIKEAITTLESISTGINKQVAQSISQSFAEGKSFAHSLKPWFANAIVEIIHSGEESGTLANALTAALNAVKQHTNVLSTLSALLTYPIIVLTLSLILLVVIKNTVLTNFANIKPIHQWPQQGISLYHLAVFIEYWWWTILVLIGMLSFCCYKLLTTYTGENREQLDRVPGFNLYRNATAARFMQTLGLLIKNGVTIKKALNIISLDANPYLAWHLINMEYRLGSGIDNIAEVLDTHLLKNEDLMRLKIIAKGKGFAEALQSLALQAHKRNSANTQLIIRISSALLLISAALIAANIIFGIYSIGSVLTN